MKINDIETEAYQFAYDGCHKIYLIENENDKFEALDNDYRLFDIEELEETYNNSCDLRFISNWGLDTQYVSQFEEAIFTYDEDEDSRLSFDELLYRMRSIELSVPKENKQQVQELINEVEKNGLKD